MILKCLMEFAKGGFSHVIKNYYKRLYPFGDEIDCVKIIKLKIIAQIADQENFDDIF